MSKPEALSPQARRGALIVVSALIVLSALAIAPYIWLSALREEVTLREAELTLVQQRAGKLAREATVRLGAEDHVERMFLAGSTPGIALAEFQHLIGEAAARSGIAVTRIQPLQGEEAGPLTTYRLVVEAAGDLSQIRSLLVDIETMLPVIVVSGIDLKPEAAPESQDQPFPSEALTLSLRLEAHGWSAPQ